MQTDLLSSSADIVVAGGSAYSGKTFALILEGCRYLNVPYYGATYFRRTKPQLFEKGAGWDTAFPILSGLGGVPNYSEATWYFETDNGEYSTFGFRACQHEKDIEGYRTSSMPTLLLDEGVLFTERQIWGLWSRCRLGGNLKGVSPCMRIGTNPDPDHFLAEFMSWWINQETGFPIQERSGVIRHFVRHDETIHWGEPEHLKKHFGKDPISFTFIPGLIKDNPIGQSNDPSYLPKLENLPLVDRERLLKGNWKIRVGSGMVKRDWLSVHPAAPPDLSLVRWWDTAATGEEENPNAAFTCGVLMGKDSKGDYWVVDVRRERVAGRERDTLMLSTSQLDRELYGHVAIWTEQEPGGAGKTDARAVVRLLAGFDVSYEPSTGDKVTRFKPFARQCEARNVRLVAGTWNESYVRELEAFPRGKFKDQADASSGAFAKCSELSGPGGTGVYTSDIPTEVDLINPSAFQ